MGVSFHVPFSPFLLFLFPVIKVSSMSRNRVLALAWMGITRVDYFHDIYLPMANIYPEYTEKPFHSLRGSFAVTFSRLVSLCCVCEPLSHRNKGAVKESDGSGSLTKQREYHDCYQHDGDLCLLILTFISPGPLAKLLPADSAFGDGIVEEKVED